MLGIDRRAMQVAWALFLFVLLLLVIYQIRRTLVIFALALFFSQLLSPVVEFVDQFTSKRVSRTVALSLVYVVLVAALVSLVVEIGSRIGEEAAVFANKLPEIIQQPDPLSKVPMPSWLEPVRPRLNALLRDRMKDLDKQIVPLLNRAGLQIVAGIQSLLIVILIPILSFFFLKDGPAIREAIVESVATRQRGLVDDIFADLHLLLAQYIRALVILSMATFVFYFTFLSIVGASFAVLLAGTAAVLEFIPVVGPLTASIVIVMVAALTGYPHLLWIVLFLAVYRIFQDYVLNPYLMSAGVEIHPMLVLFGVLAGEQLAGIPGMFFSVPTMAALRMILIRLRRRRSAA